MKALQHGHPPAFRRGGQAGHPGQQVVIGAMTTRLRKAMPQVSGKEANNAGYDVGLVLRREIGLLP